MAEKSSGTSLVLDGLVLSSDGARRIAVSKAGTPGSADQIGTDVANLLLAEDAEELITTCRESRPGPSRK